MTTGLHSFFLPAADGRSGQRLCIHHTPADGVVTAAVLYTHPFAEEMNKSRRMAALTSRALARANCAVLQIDLLGCGDSSGDFGDATWDAWLADVELGARWLHAQYDARHHEVGTGAHGKEGATLALVVNHRFVSESQHVACSAAALGAKRNDRRIARADGLLDDVADDVSLTAVRQLHFVARSPARRTGGSRRCDCGARGSS